MDRRTFIKNSSLGTAGFLSNSSFPFQDNPLLGQGNKRYRLNTKWSQADVARNPVNDCHEMVQDSKGRIILLTNETKNNVIFFNKKGKLLKTWGHDFPGAHGLTLWGDKEQFLFITDTVKNQFYKATIDGQ